MGADSTHPGSASPTPTRPCETDPSACSSLPDRDDAAMTPSPPVALTYLRLSTPDRTEHASIDRQREDCLALTEHLTLTGREEFTDKAVSAYQRRQRRPGFDRLLDRLRDLNRVVIVTWHLDRLLRQPVQLEELLDLASTRHVRIETVHGGGLDLSGHEGRLFARFLVAFANYESALKATRVSRAHQQRASAGLWHAGPAYGYGTGGTLNPQQAIIVRQIADDYLAGCSPQEIARRLNAQGIPTAGRSSGWHPSTVRAILSSDRLHGHRRFTDTNDATATVNGRWPMAADHHAARVRPRSRAARPARTTDHELEPKPARRTRAMRGLRQDPRRELRRQPAPPLRLPQDQYPARVRQRHRRRPSRRTHWRGLAKSAGHLSPGGCNAQVVADRL